MTWTRGFALVLVFGLGAVSAPGQTTQSSTNGLVFVGTATLGGPSADQPEEGNFMLQTPDGDASFAKPQLSGTISPARVPPDHVPRPTGNTVTSAPVSGFLGLTHRDQRLAATGVPGGEQFSVEPPDQGLAVGNGFLVEAVNDAIAVYDTSGKRLRRKAMSLFLGLAPGFTIDPTTGGLTFGPFLADPRVYFDWDTGHFFASVLEIDTDPVTGNFANKSSVFIAVSQTNDPTFPWSVFALDVTNDGDAAFGSCPCSGDQPLIGADKYGFYISTNAFSLSTSRFRGAQIYAFSKSALVGGVLPAAVRFSNLTQAEGPGFSIQPATVPPHGSFESGDNGTEFFVSSLNFTSTLDNRVTVWALTNTSSLDGTPNLQLGKVVITTEVYGQPPDTQQESGPTPLLDFLASSGSPFGIIKNHSELVTSNDTRMQQVVFADGKLWTALNTVVKTSGPVRTGAAYFILSPSVGGGQVSSTVASQGYVAIDSPRQNSVMFPSIGVNASGKGVIGFSVIGEDFFPSAAYATLDATNGAGPIVISAPGAFPDDGFSGYVPFAFRSARWGDYSAAVADENGVIWLGNEFTPNARRTLLANWGTFIAQVTP